MHVYHITSANLMFTLYKEDNSIFNEKQLQKHQVYCDIAKVLSTLSHCVSKQVGCLIVRDGRIISTGINGSIPGYENCDEHFNRDSFDRQAHHLWSNINECHAEQNAIARAAYDGISIKDSDMYLTLSPCEDCAKLISISGIKRVFFTTIYDRYDSPIWSNILLNNKIELYHLSQTPMEYGKGE